MSCTRTIKTFESQVIKIDTCNKKELEMVQEAILKALKQKLEKLNILIRNCNIYSYNGNILVNDRYNVCSDLIAVAQAFGLTIKQIDCSLRGKNYLITDKLVEFLKQLDVNYDFGKEIKNQELTDEIIEIINNNMPQIKINSKLLQMIKNIKLNGQYKIEATREIETTVRDNIIIDKQVGSWSVDSNKINDTLQRFSQDMANTVNMTNSQLRDGTAKLIYARARQMGYAVQEVKKGTQTQLVLVRYE